VCTSLHPQGMLCGVMLEPGRRCGSALEGPPRCATCAQASAALRAGGVELWRRAGPRRAPAALPEQLAVPGQRRLRRGAPCLRARRARGACACASMRPAGRLTPTPSKPCDAWARTAFALDVRPRCGKLAGGRCVTSLCRPLGAQRGRPAAPPCLASRPRALQTAGGERAQAGPFDAQDARLILSPPQPALAECLIPPSAALAFEPRERGGDAGAGAAAWDLGNGRLGVRARRLLLGAHVAGPEPPGIVVHRVPCFCWLLISQHVYMSN